MCSRASHRSLTGLSFSPNSTNHSPPQVSVPQGTVDKWYPTVGLPCIPTSVHCVGIRFQKSMFVELVGTDREECPNPLILGSKRGKWGRE